MSSVTLIGKIRQDLSDLKTLNDQTERLLRKVISTGDLDYVGTVALHLHSFYSGTERIFQEIAREVDESMPEGSDWHRRLLRQMSAEVITVRPPVISVKTRDRLSEFCAFRHVVRNIYTFELQFERVQDLAAKLPDCFALVSQDLQDFCLFLEAI